LKNDCIEPYFFYGYKNNVCFNSENPVTYNGFSFNISYEFSYPYWKFYLDYECDTDKYLGSVDIEVIADLGECINANLTHAYGPYDLDYGSQYYNLTMVNDTVLLDGNEFSVEEPSTRRLDGQPVVTPSYASYSYYYDDFIRDTPTYASYTLSKTIIGGMMIYEIIPLIFSIFSPNIYINFLIIF
jgi:hypothetical protein